MFQWAEENLPGDDHDGMPLACLPRLSSKALRAENLCKTTSKFITDLCFMCTSLSSFSRLLSSSFSGHHISFTCNLASAAIPERKLSRKVVFEQREYQFASGGIMYAGVRRRRRRVHPIDDIQTLDSTRSYSYRTRSPPIE